jgi:hypothetical protein
MYVFGDGFDLYQSPVDVVSDGYWDDYYSSGGFTLVPGRFGGQAMQLSSAGYPGLVKNSGSNDRLHHVNLAIMQTAPLMGSTRGAGFSLSDGTTPQCTVVFRSDGSLLLTLGTSSGAILASFPDAITAPNIWYGFEFEIILHNTTGSIAVRRNSEPVNTFFKDNIDTCSTANNYANRLTVGMGGAGSVTYQLLDDVLWRSDQVSVPWQQGETRGVIRRPETDAAVQFTPESPTTAPWLFYNPGSAFAGGPPVNTVWFDLCPSSATGPCIALQLYLTAVGPAGGHFKLALYDSTGPTSNIFSSPYPGPGALIAVTTEVTGPVGPGVLKVPLTTFPTVVKNQNYWVAMLADTAGFYSQGAFLNSVISLPAPYSGGFPSLAYPGQSENIGNGYAAVGMVIQYAKNADVVNDAVWEVSGTPWYRFPAGTTSNVVSSTLGHTDLYGLDAPPPGNYTIIGTTVRSWMKKSNAGPRGGVTVLRSGSTTVATPAGPVMTNGIWRWRTDLVDPDTGFPWTKAAVDAVKIGARVTEA